MLTKKIEKDLRGHTEPRPDGVETPTGMHKIADGTLIITRTQSVGGRTSSPEDIEAAAAKMEELEQMRAAQQAESKPRRRSRKQTKEPAEEPAHSVTITIEGFGGIPSQYDQVCVGNDMAMLGIVNSSFIPQPAEIVDGKPSQVIRLSVAPDKRYVYFGSQIVDKRGITNLILIELKGS